MPRLAVIGLLSLLLTACGDNLKPAQPEAPKMTPPAGTPTTDLSNALRRDDEGLVIETLPDGTERMDLQGRFRDVLVAVRNPDGTISIVNASAGPTPPRSPREFK